jgi:hypothetical protein
MTITIQNKFNVFLSIIGLILVILSVNYQNYILMTLGVLLIGTKINY